MNTFSDISVKRVKIKKPVMTVFYGSTQQPKEVFGEGKALVAFYTALKERLGGAYELMGIFQQYWNPFAKFHSWKLPDGHIARVPVIQTLEKSLEVDEFEHMRFAFRAQVIQPKATSRSLAANIVHSIDGWIVREMVKKAYEQGFWMAPIHDCFYASPNYMNQVRQNYLTILQRLSKMNLVSSILSDIAGQQVMYCKKSYDLFTFIADAEYALS
jgi:hypothetical protein